MTYDEHFSFGIPRQCSRLASTKPMNSGDALHGVLPFFHFKQGMFCPNSPKAAVCCGGAMNQLLCLIIWQVVCPCSHRPVFLHFLRCDELLGFELKHCTPDTRKKHQATEHGIPLQKIYRMKMGNGKFHRRALLTWLSSEYCEGSRIIFITKTLSSLGFQFIQGRGIGKTIEQTTRASFPTHNAPDHEQAQ